MKEPTWFDDFLEDIVETRCRLHMERRCGHERAGQDGACATCGRPGIDQDLVESVGPALLKFAEAMRDCGLAMAEAAEALKAGLGSLPASVVEELQRAEDRRRLSWKRTGFGGTCRGGRENMPVSVDGRSMIGRSRPRSGWRRLLPADGIVSPLDRRGAFRRAVIPRRSGGFFYLHSFLKFRNLGESSRWKIRRRCAPVKACGSNLPKLQGTVEVDETYIGGKESAKHESKKLRMGRGAVGKTPVLAMRQRGGPTRAKPVPNVDADSVLRHIHEGVEVGATVYSDEASVYGDVGGLFFHHETVNHSAGEYSRGRVSTNAVESVFAVLKRGLHGVYHHASPKHLGRYVDEFAFRLNEGNCARHTLARLDSFIDATVGRRLTYAELTR